MTSDLDYRAIRKRVEAGIAQRKFRTRMGFFVGTLFLYIMFMIIGWSIFLTSGQSISIPDSSGLTQQVMVGVNDNVMGAMIMLSMSGFMGLIFQAVSLSMDTRRGEERIREQLVTQEINRAMLRMGLDDVEEHDKRKGMMRLTDDGELEEVIEDTAALDEEVPLKQRR